MRTLFAACVVVSAAFLACSQPGSNYTNPNANIDGSFNTCFSDAGCVFPDAALPDSGFDGGVLDGGDGGVADAGLNVMACPGGQPFGSSVSSQTTNLIMVEVNTTPPEFVELYNPNGTSMNAGTYSLSSPVGSSLTIGEISANSFAMVALNSTQHFNPDGGDLMLISQTSMQPDIQYVCWGNPALAAQMATAMSDGLWDSNCVATNGQSAQLTGASLASDSAWTAGPACLP